MNHTRSYLSTIIASLLFVMSASAALAQTPEQRAPELRQYTFGQLTADRYEVVSREWADSWRTAFSPPTFPTREQAIAALNDDAVARGADALLNVYCLDEARGKWWWWRSTEPAILCYAIGIRVKPS